jgi:hypothetical protein
VSNPSDYDFDFSDWGEMFDGGDCPYDIDQEDESSLIDTMFSDLGDEIPIIHLDYPGQDELSENDNIARSNYVTPSSSLQGNVAIMDNFLYVYHNKQVHRIQYLVEANMWVIDTVRISSLPDVLAKAIDPLYGFENHSDCDSL